MKSKILFILLLINISIKGQDLGSINGPSLTKSYIPQTPLSAMFEKYTTHNITEYNGLPEIKIPLYEIKIDGIIIPVFLSYHAAGIKYKQFDGDIGAGWMLNVGSYRISRRIYGLPDESSTFKHTPNNLISNSGNNRTLDKYLASMYSNKGISYSSSGDGGPSYESSPVEWLDGQFDIFSFSTPNSTGHFFLHDRAANKVKVFEPLNILVSLNRSQFNKINILDDSGNQYKFGGNAGNETIYYSLNSSVISSWPLERIQTVNNKTINFSYKYINTELEKERPLFFKVYDDSYIVDYTDYANSYFPSSRYLDEGIYGYIEKCDLAFIETITTDTETLSFERNSNNLLTNIKIKNNVTGEIIKTITLTQNNILHHTQLISVTETIGTTNKKYLFDYNNPTSASELSYDEWGYYTNKPSNNSYFLHSDFKNMDYLQEQHYTSLSIMRIPFWSWIDKYKNSINTTNLFSLKSITYPTGGYTVFDYEMNKYKSNVAGRPSIITGCGQRIRSIKSFPDKGGQAAIITNYKYGSDNNTTGILSSSIYFNPSSMFYDQRGIVFQNNDYLHRTQAIQAVRSFSNKSLSDISPDIFCVNYDKVEIEEFDPIANTGFKTVFIHDVKFPYEYGAIIENRFPSGLNLPIIPISNGEGMNNIFSFNYGNRPLLKSKTYYNSKNEKVKEETYEYIRSKTEIYEGLKVIQNYSFYFIQDGMTRPCFNISDDEIAYQYIRNFFGYMRSKIHTGGYLVKNITDVDYFPNSTKTSTTTYNYDEKNRIINTNKDGIIKEYTYPLADKHTALIDKNIITRPIESQTKKGGILIEKAINSYSAFSIYPKSTTIYNGSSDNQTLEYKNYDPYGNAVYITKNQNINTCYLWSYYGQYLIAEIKNATFSQVSSAVRNIFGLNIDQLSQLKNPDPVKIALLQKDSNLANALVSTFAYRPLIGILSASDPSGVTTYYEYDSVGRLLEVYIMHQGNKTKIEAYNYNYAK